MNLMECSYEDEGPKFTPKHSSLIMMHLPLLYCPQKVEVSGSGGGGVSSSILCPTSFSMILSLLISYIWDAGMKRKGGREACQPLPARRKNVVTGVGNCSSPTETAAGSEASWCCSNKTKITEQGGQSRKSNRPQPGIAKSLSEPTVFGNKGYRSNQGPSCMMEDVYLNPLLISADAEETIFQLALIWVSPFWIHLTQGHTRSECYRICS